MDRLLPLERAAEFGVKHAKWHERPLLFALRQPGRVAKRWVPDDGFS